MYSPILSENKYQIMTLYCLDKLIGNLLKTVETKNPCVKHKGQHTPVSLYEDGALLPDPLRPDNGGVSGKGYYQPILVAFAFPTPRPIRHLRYHPISTVQGLSAVRFDDYFSGSQSFRIDWPLLYANSGGLSRTNCCKFRRGSLCRGMIFTNR